MMINILLLGQQVHTQQMADVLLSLPGYSVIEADTRWEGRRLFETFPDNFDVVVADIDSPPVRGLEFLADLRRIGSPVSIVVITKDKNRLVDAIGYGIADYLVQPFPKERLVKVLRRALASDNRIRMMVNASRPFTIHPSIRRISLPSAR